MFKQAAKKPKLPKHNCSGRYSILFFLSDWQLGKNDYGVENTIKRFDVALQDGLQLIKELQKIGYQIDEVYLIGMGDLTENCTKFFYDSQPHNVSLNLLEQYALLEV